MSRSRANQHPHGADPAQDAQREHLFILTLDV